MNIQLGVMCTNMVDYGRPGHTWAELLGSIAVHFLTFYEFMKLHFHLYRVFTSHRHPNNTTIQY